MPKIIPHCSLPLLVAALHTGTRGGGGDTRDGGGGKCRCVCVEGTRGGGIYALLPAASTILLIIPLILYIDRLMYTYPFYTELYSIL